MTLSPTQIAHFKRDGYLHLPQIIPTPMWETALQTINHRIGQGVPEDQLQTWRAQSWFPEIARSPLICDLFNATGLRPTLQSLMGESNVHPIEGGQLALRFPQPPGAPLRPIGGHIDGIYTPTNGVPKGTLGSFSALVGVFLTDVCREDAGGFTVWPGSHTKMQDYFRQHGTDITTHEGKTPPIEQGEPRQLHVRAGDAVLAHYQLLHGVAPHHGPHPRFAVFFRVWHPEHKIHRLECLTDLWREWPGVG